MVSSQTFGKEKKERNEGKRRETKEGKLKKFLRQTFVACLEQISKYQCISCIFHAFEMYVKNMMITKNRGKNKMEIIQRMVCESFSWITKSCIKELLF